MYDVSVSRSADSRVCEVGVQVYNEWETCMEETDMEWCGTTCADLRSNPYHCGECGNFWGDDDHGGWCEGGECVPDPQLTLLAPDHMDGCEPGYFGRDCASPCPGLLETGTACSGRGVCDDGPLGAGRCRCDMRGLVADAHGLMCEFTCRDGIRNGRESSIDCGSPYFRCEGF